MENGIFVVYDDEPTKCPHCLSRVENEIQCGKDEDGIIYTGTCLGCGKEVRFQIVNEKEWMESF